jgi:hypothetical protein
METRRRLYVVVALTAVGLIAAFVFSFVARPSVADAQSKVFLSVFQAIQQKGQTDPHFAFSVQSYGAAASGPGLSISTINASANSIIDMGDNYVCLGSIKVDSSADLKTVCLPFSAIVQVQATNTLFN